MSAAMHRTASKWEEVRFRYLANVCKGSLPSSGDKASLNAEGVPYLTMEYLRGEITDPKLVSIAPDILLASDDDILLLWDGSNAGEFLRAKRGAVSSTAALITPKSVDPVFFFWACKGQEDWVRAETVGMGIPHVNGDFLANTRIQLPDISQQRAIADYLDRETARLDALVAAKERLLALLAEKRRALVTRAVTRGLDPRVPTRDSGVPWMGAIPAHWKQCHLKRVLSDLDYGLSVQVNTEGDVAVLRMGDIRDGEIDYSNVGFVQEINDALLLQPGDLVFNRTNSLDQIGKVALFRGASEYPVSFASYLVRLRCNDAVLPQFLRWLLNSVRVLAWARSEALPAIGQANLNPYRYGYLPIALPPIFEQKAIVEFVEAACKKLDALQAVAIRTMELLKERRAALVAVAVTGQLDIESASRESPPLNDGLGDGGEID